MALILEAVVEKMRWSIQERRKLENKLIGFKYKFYLYLERGEW